MTAFVWGKKKIRAWLGATAVMLACCETFNCAIIQRRTEPMARAAASARLLKPRKPISDPAPRAKWAGRGPF